MQPVIFANDLTKVYSEGKLRTEVLNGVSIEVQEGEMLAIVGPSGSGKSTLLHILGGLDSPTLGKVVVNGVNIHGLSEKSKSVFRNKYLGFVYQFHHLLPEFSALENIAMPLLIGGMSVNDAKMRARDLLVAIGLEKREYHRVGELSGGERQRVAIARALSTNPKCVLADEPTGNLDHKTALQIYDLIFKLRSEFNTSFIVVTHDLAVARRMTRVLLLEDGRFITKA